MINIKYLLISSSFLLLWLNYNSTSSMFVSIFGILFLYKFLIFIEKIGEKVVILDLLSILAIFQWLFAPALYYMIYEHKMILWEWYYIKMQVPIDEYFTLAIPSTLLFIIGLDFFIKKSEFNRKFFLSQIAKYKTSNYKIGIYLVLTGFLSSLLSRFLPSTFDFIIYILKDLSYVGILYIYYSNSNLRIPILLSSVALTVYGAVVSGMFGGIIWWPMMLGFIITLDKKPGMLLKITSVTFLLILFTLIQNVKGDYREIIWRGKPHLRTEDNSSVFIRLFKDNLDEKKSSFLSMETIYPLISRMNHGYHVTMAQAHTPSIEPFCYGETIADAILSTLIPRFLWPDKPKSGGKYLYERFTGYKLERASMNIGQIGDAYVNFGNIGGPIFLFVYGSLISYLFNTSLLRIKNDPTFIFWIPFLFMSIMTVETDFLSTINGLIKPLIFGIILFNIVKRLSRIR